MINFFFHLLSLNNIRLILFLYIEGITIFFIALFQIIPFLFSIYYQENDSLAFLISILFSLFIASILYLISFKRKEKENFEIKIQYSLLIVPFTWIIIAFFSSLPFIIYVFILGFSADTMNTFTNIYFEMMSGFSTTGATILKNIESLPKGLLLWRSFSQFLGGMGIILFTISILPALGIGGLELYHAEVPGGRIYYDKIAPRVHKMAKKLWAIYIVLFTFQFLLLMFGGINFFDALCHSFSTVSTGGFSTKNYSIDYYSSYYIRWVFIIFMFLSSINFTLHYRFFFYGESYNRDKEFKFYIYIILFSIFIIVLSNYKYLIGDYFFERLFSIIFQVISIITTTGFTIGIEETNTSNLFHYGLWTYPAQMVIFMLMIFGASAGSTAGGLKAIRIYIFFKFISRQLEWLLYPKHVKLLQFGSNFVSDRSLLFSISIILIYIIYFVCFSFLILIFDDAKPIEAFSAVASTLGNVGPGLGLIGPDGNYSDFSIFSKWVLIFSMLLGRLEYYSLMVLLLYAFSKKFRF